MKKLPIKLVAVEIFIGFQQNCERNYLPQFQLSSYELSAATTLHLLETILIEFVEAIISHYKIIRT